MLDRLAAEGLPLGPSIRIRLLAGNARAFLQVLKSDRGVNIITQNRFAGRQLAMDDALDGLAQKRSTEIWVALRPCPDGFLEIVG